jgi:hypothetical protein
MENNIEFSPEYLITNTCESNNLEMIKYLFSLEQHPKLDILNYHFLLPIEPKLMKLKYKWKPLKIPMSKIIKTWYCYDYKYNRNY